MANATCRASMRRPVFMIFLLLAGQMGPSMSAASRGVPDTHVCDAAAGIAARETGIPADILMAITRTETGRQRQGAVQPWPWTVNMEGKGKWFETQGDARSYVSGHFRRGARSFDVGCFQLNYRWHGEAFSSIDEMFEPLANARYAAGFLKRLYHETGNWMEAAGAYHSRTPEHANRYKSRFARMLQTLPTAPATQTVAARARPVDPLPGPRENTFPLLQQGGTRRAGSLVSLPQGGFPFLRGFGG